jgi:hypothetical protein
MILKKMTFPQALTYLGEERARPTRQEKAKLTRERKKREAAEWRERDLAWTLGIAIRQCHEALKKLSRENFDSPDMTLILTELETIQFQHDILIHGDPAARAELVRELAGLRLFKRTLLFRKNFDFRAWLRAVNKPPPVEVAREPQRHEQPRIEISFG